MRNNFNIHTFSIKLSYFIDTCPASDIITMPYFQSALSRLLSPSCAQAYTQNVRIICNNKK